MMHFEENSVGVQPSSLHGIAVFIPAWQPEEVLLTLARALRGAGIATVLILDDGSRAASQPIFEVLLAENFPVLRHAVNLGKGRALKSGFNAILSEYPQVRGVVTADADGQHTVVDIVRVAQALADSLASSRQSAVLGCRRFDAAVPFRSRFGNALTRWIFRMIAGTRIADTQTGLRGFSASQLPGLLMLQGERYEYEMNVLMHLCNQGPAPIEVPIETVYIDSNRSSHFNPVLDSMRIYFVLFRFYLSSISAAALDLLLFSLVFSITHRLMLSIVCGRLSSILNFTLNRQFVFHNRGSVVSALGRYYALAATIATISYGLLWLLTVHARWNVFLAKVCVDIPLSLASFSVQRIFIFRPDNKSAS